MVVCVCVATTLNVVVLFEVRGFSVVAVSVAVENSHISLSSKNKKYDVSKVVHFNILFNKGIT